MWANAVVTQHVAWIVQKLLGQRNSFRCIDYKQSPLSVRKHRFFYCKFICSDDVTLNSIPSHCSIIGWLNKHEGHGGHLAHNRRHHMLSVLNFRQDNRSLAMCHWLNGFEITNLDGFQIAMQHIVRRSFYRLTPPFFFFFFHPRDKKFRPFCQLVGRCYLYVPWLAARFLLSRCMHTDPFGHLLASGASHFEINRRVAH